MTKATDVIEADFHYIIRTFLIIVLKNKINNEVIKSNNYYGLDKQL